MDVFCLFGVFSCHFERPQNLLTKLFSGILEGCIGMRFPQRAKKLAQWLRSRRSNSPLMELMVHQNSLMLLFVRSVDNIKVIWDDKLGNGVCKNVVYSEVLLN